MKVLSNEEVQMPAGGLAFIPMLAWSFGGGVAAGFIGAWAKDTF